MKNISKIILCDTLSHPTPILLEWSYGLIDLGYETLYLPIPQHSVTEIDEPADVLVYAGIPADDYHLQQFLQFKNKFPDCKIIGATDQWRAGYEQFKNVVDFFIMTQHENNSLVKSFNDNGFKLYSVPLAGNHRLFHKISKPELYDASFIGNLTHGYRGEDKFLYPILDNNNYNCFLGGISYGRYQNGFLPYDQHNDIRNSTKINLNFHVPYQKPNKGDDLDRVDLNQSVFNIALSGNFQLCDHPLVHDIFKGTIPIGNEENWLELFEYYLHQPDLRYEMAFHAKLIAEQQHTWIVRMKEFIEIVNKHFLEI